MSGLALRRMRESKGFSRDRLARESGLTVATIFQLEMKDRSPGLDTARKVADALGVTVDEVFPPASESDEPEAVNQ